jgi:hypothetical protein
MLAAAPSKAPRKVDWMGFSSAFLVASWPHAVPSSPEPSLSVAKPSVRASATPGVRSEAALVVLLPCVSKALPASTPPAPLLLSLRLAGAK